MRPQWLSPHYLVLVLPAWETCLEVPFLLSSIANWHPSCSHIPPPPCVADPEKARSHSRIDLPPLWGFFTPIDSPPLWGPQEGTGYIAMLSPPHCGDPKKAGALQPY